MSIKQQYPYVAGETIGDAYTAALKTALDGQDYLVIHVDNPVSAGDVPDTLEWDAWQDCINAGDAQSAFESYSFDDGTTGRFWVEDRIEALFNGEYAERLRTPRNQIEMITERLQLGNHGQTTNALVGQVFQVDPDLDRATHGRPLAPDMACLTQVQFKPSRDTLDLYATFRSQYLDTKCYGNLISLGMLLAIVADRTGYTPGTIVEMTHNATFRTYGDAKQLRSELTPDDEYDPNWRMETPRA